MKKIALCFLTYGNLTQPTLWNKFIDHTKYNVYIHNKYDFECEYNFHNYCISNRIDTKWGDISLVKATLLLFEEAIKNEDNSFFLLLSDKCIPLYNSSFIYNKIFEIDNNIILCTDQHNNRYNEFYAKSFIKREDFKTSNQWILLNRDTTNFFVQNNFTNHFGNEFFAPDEHYFVNICLRYNISFINKEITYTNWDIAFELKEKKNINPTHPHTYIFLNKNILNKIREKGDYLFMRKIDKNCKFLLFKDASDYINNYNPKDINNYLIIVDEVYKRVLKRHNTTWNRITDKNTPFDLKKIM
jgi:hypothetical protein